MYFPAISPFLSDRVTYIHIGTWELLLSRKCGRVPWLVSCYEHLWWIEVWKNKLLVESDIELEHSFVFYPSIPCILALCDFQCCLLPTHKNYMCYLVNTLCDTFNYPPHPSSYKYILVNTLCDTYYSTSPSLLFKLIVLTKPLAILSICSHVVLLYMPLVVPLVILVTSSVCTILNLLNLLVMRWGIL